LPLKQVENKLSPNDKESHWLIDDFICFSFSILAKQTFFMDNVGFVVLSPP